MFKTITETRAGGKPGLLTLLLAGMCSDSWMKGFSGAYLILTSAWLQKPEQQQSSMSEENSSIFGP